MKYLYEIFNYTTGEEIYAKNKQLLKENVVGVFGEYEMVKIKKNGRNVFTGYVKDSKTFFK